MRFKLTLFVLSTVALQCRASLLDELVYDAHAKAQNEANNIIGRLTQQLNMERYKNSALPPKPDKPFVPVFVEQLNLHEPRPHHPPKPHFHGKYPPPPPPPPPHHFHGKYPPPPPRPPSPPNSPYEEECDSHEHFDQHTPHNHHHTYNDHFNNGDFDNEYNNFGYLNNMNNQQPGLYGFLNNPGQGYMPYNGNEPGQVYDQHRPGYGYRPNNQNYRPNSNNQGHFSSGQTSQENQHGFPVMMKPNNQNYPNNYQNSGNGNNIQTTENYNKHPTVEVPKIPQENKTPIPPKDVGTTVPNQLGGNKGNPTVPNRDMDTTTVKSDEDDVDVPIDVRFKTD